MVEASVVEVDGRFGGSMGFGWAGDSVMVGEFSVK